MGVSHSLQLRRTKKRLDNIALLVGELASVKIQFTSHGMASTDGKVINIRVGDFSDPHYVNMAIGLAFHEGGHIKHTDFEVTKNISKQWFGVLNALEDVRMEGLVQRDFKGAKKYLHYVNKTLFTQSDVKEYSSPFSLVHDYILYRGFTMFTDNVLMQPKMLKMRDQLLDFLGEPNALKVESIIDEIEHAKSTSDSLTITNKLRDFLQQITLSQDDTDSSDDSNDNGQNDSGQSDSASGATQNSASGDNSGNDSGNDSGNHDDASSSSASSSTSTDEGDSDGVTNGDGDVEPSEQSGDGVNNGEDAKGMDTSGASSINQSQTNPFDDENIDDSECMGELHDAVRNIVNDLAYEYSRANTDEWRENFQYSAELIGSIEDSPNGYDDAMVFDCVKGQINQLKLIFKRALLDQARVRRNYVRDGGVLDGQRVLDIVTSPSTACIFRNEKRAKAPSAAVSIIVDASASMWHSPDNDKTYYFRIANQAAFAMASALDRLPHVECEVRHMVKDSSLITKPFKLPADPNIFGVAPAGCTPTHKLVRGAIGSLCGHRFDKKLIIVVTDGEPDEVDSLRLAVSDAQIAGIDVKGIGIDHPTVGIDDGVIIKDIESLHGTLMRAVSDGIFN